MLRIWVACKDVSRTLGISHTVERGFVLLVLIYLGSHCCEKVPLFADFTVNMHGGLRIVP